MTAIKPENTGEKWVLYLGRNSSGKSGTYWIFIWIGFIILYGWRFLVTGNHDYMFLAVIWFFIAVRSFEIRHFYRIIERQREQLDSYGKKTDGQGDIAE